MRNGGVWEAESNMELFALVSVERIMITPLVIMKAPWASRSMLHAYARLAESCVDRWFLLMRRRAMLDGGCQLESLLPAFNGTQRMGLLASCRASNAIAPGHPARKNIQSLNKRTALGT